MKKNFVRRYSPRYHPIQTASEDQIPLHDGFSGSRHDFWHPRDLLMLLRESDFIHSVYWLWLNIALVAVSTTMFSLSLRIQPQSCSSNIEKSRNYLLKQMSMTCELIWISALVEDLLMRPSSYFR
jgi:hypothetical protein